jgi:hypothetical protein
MMVWSILYFIAVAIIITARVSAVVGEFQQRFPGREERAAAMAHLKSVAQNKQDAAAEAAQKFVAAIEQKGMSAITQRPTISSRGPGGKAH